MTRASDPGEAERLSSMNADIVQRQVDAYNRRDLDDFLNFYHPETEVYNLSEMEPVIKGVHELREVYGRIFRESPALHCEVEYRKIYGDFFIDGEFVTGLKSFPDGLRTGVIYQVVDRRIRTVWFTR